MKSGGPGDADLSWERRVLQQFAVRDRQQRDPFTQVTSIHSQLQKSNQKLQARVKSLEAEISTLRRDGGSVGGASGADSEQTKRKLAALQAELGELYKRDSEGSRERLRLSSDNEQLLRENQRLKETAASAAASIAAASEAEEALRNRVATVEGDCETLKDELDSIRKTLAREEEAAHALRRENDSLVARLVSDKQKAAQELNRMNAQIQILKSRQESKGSASASPNAFLGAAGAGEDADGDATPDEPGAAGGGDDDDDLWEMVGAAAEGAIPQTTKHVIDAHEQDINSVCFSESSAIVASASSDGTVALWDAVTAKRRGLLRGGDGSGAIMCAHVWGGVAAGGSSSRVTYVWDLSTERVRLNITGHAGKVYAAQFVHGGRTLVTASTDRTVKLWDLSAGGQCVRTIDGKSIVNCMVVSSDGMSVVTGHQNSMVALWDARTGGKMAENKAQHSTAITDVRLSSAADQHSYVLSMSKDNSLALLDARTLAPAEGGHRRGAGGGVGGASPSAARAPTAPDKMPARTRGGSWGLGSMLSSLSSGLSGGGASTAMPPTSSSAAGGGAPQPPQSASERGPSMRHQEFRVPFNWSDAALSPRGVLPSTVEAATGRQGAAAAGGGLPHYLAAAGGADGRVYLWDVATKWQVACLDKVHSKPVAAVAFSGDGRRLVTGDGAGKLAFWQ